MRTATVETEVPEKLEESRARALSTVEQLNGEIAEIESRIYDEEKSIRSISAERERAVPAPTFERLCEISQLEQESKTRVEIMKAALSEKQSKRPAAAAALRNAETQVNLIVKASLVPLIEAATAELARMEENLQSERSSL